MERKSHAVRRVRLDALRPVRGLGEPQQAASEYCFRYSDALLAYFIASCVSSVRKRFGET